MAYRFLNNFTDEREKEYYNFDDSEYPDDDDNNIKDNNNNENDLNDFLNQEITNTNSNSSNSSSSSSIINSNSNTSNNNGIHIETKHNKDEDDDYNTSYNNDTDNGNFEHEDSDFNTYDVENYDIDTLFRFINLNRDSTDFQIKDAANNLSVVMKNKKKKDLSIFFESIRDKLLEWKKQERNTKNAGQSHPLPIGLWMDYDEQKKNTNTNTKPNANSTNNTTININNKESPASSLLLSRSSTQSPPPTSLPIITQQFNHPLINKSKNDKIIKQVKTKHLFRINTLDLKEHEQISNLFIYNFPSSTPTSNKKIKSYSVDSIQISIKNTFEEDQYFDFNGKPYFIPKGYYTTNTLCEKVFELTGGELTIRFDDKKTHIICNNKNNNNDKRGITFGLYPNKPLFYSLGMRDNTNLDKTENEIIEYESEGPDYIIGEDVHKLNTSNYFELYIDHILNKNSGPVAIFQTSSSSSSSFSSIKKRVETEIKQLYIKVLDDNGHSLKLNERSGTIILKVTTVTVD